MKTNIKSVRTCLQQFSFLKDFLNKRYTKVPLKAIRDTRMISFFVNQFKIDGMLILVKSCYHLVFEANFTHTPICMFKDRHTMVYCLIQAEPMYETTHIGCYMLHEPILFDTGFVLVKTVQI
ncbi:unnamed protein product [Musa textilis]